MRKALGDAFREYFVIILLAACVLLVVSPPNYKTLSVLHYLIADCLSGLVMVLILGFIKKDWQRAVSFGIISGGALVLVDLCYWLVKYSNK